MVDFCIVVDFDVDLSIFLWIVGKEAKEWKHVCLNFSLPECKLATTVMTQFA